jgi:MerR family transcriptional regulator, copper efflux regulator
MQPALTITNLAKSAGVTTKTLRYWERIGLLPRANRTHTGYRLFAHDAIQYIEFILKAKSVGLTLAEMKQVVKLAHAGRNPCPDVLQWIDQRDKELAQQIQSMRALQRRLRRFRRACSTTSVTSCDCGREGELCCLIEDLPNPMSVKGDGHEKTLLVGSSHTSHSRS